MTDRELVSKVVSKLYDKYGSYAHAAGYLESTVAGLLEGYDTVNDVRQRLAAALRELELENVNG